MPALNKVQVIGRLGKDPESKFTPSGKKVVHFSVAVSERWKSREGESKESTEWINVEAWDLDSVPRDVVNREVTREIA